MPEEDWPKASLNKYFNNLLVLTRIIENVFLKEEELCNRFYTKEDF